jgi:hypothetical protein
VAAIQRLIPRSLTPRQQPQEPLGEGAPGPAKPSPGSSVEEGIRASVQDPLWFLARQWQMGEFTAGNCGSVANVKLKTAVRKIDSVYPGKEIQPVAIDDRIPLEPCVESGGAYVKNGGVNLDAPKAWAPENLEYRFAIGAGNGALRPNADTLLTAQEYYGERLDWYNFSLDRLSFPGAPADGVRVYASPVAFSGMPRARWWQFEDSRVDLGDIQRPNLNFLSVLLAEFALVYSNDWFLIPAPLAVNSLRKVADLSVTNVFGETTSIPSHTCSLTEEQQALAFTLFTHPIGQQFDSSVLFLPNTLTQHVQSDPYEEVVFFRDEMANLVWGVEKKYYEQGTGIVTRGDEEPEREDLLPGPASLPLYRLKSRVPPHWVPYVPIQIADDSGQIYFRRGRTRVLSNGKQYKSKLIGDGWKIMEEEIPSTPVALTQHVKMAVYEKEDHTRQRLIWVARRKNHGVRLSGSGLRFDFLLEPDELAGNSVLDRNCSARLLAVDNGIFYWVDPGRTVLYRGHLDNGRLQCEGSVDDNCINRLLAVDGGILYWVDRNDTKLFTGRIQNGGLNCEGTLEGDCPARLLAADGGVLYMVDAGKTDLYPARVVNGALVRGNVLFSNFTSELLAVDGGVFYWNDPAKKALYAGRVVNGKLLCERTMDGNCAARLLAVNGGILYRVNQGSTTLFRSRT